VPQEVSGVQKVHALVGGFHLGATADPQLKLVIIVARHEAG
jgi:metal-dependent hydrolase (beta-lactamase superfamily II)